MQNYRTYLIKMMLISGELFTANKRVVVKTKRVGGRWGTLKALNTDAESYLTPPLENVILSVCIVRSVIRGRDDFVLSQHLQGTSAVPNVKLMSCASAYC